MKHADAVLWRRKDQTIERQQATIRALTEALQQARDTINVITADRDMGRPANESLRYETVCKCDAALALAKEAAQ